MPDAQATIFARKGKSGAKNNGSTNDHWQKTTTCHHCHKKGHIRPNCPKIKEDDSDKEEVSGSLKSSKPHSKKKKRKSQDDKKVALAQCNNHDDDSNDKDSIKYDFCNIRWAGKKKPKLCNCIFLDNQLMMDLFCNEKLISCI